VGVPRNSRSHGKLSGMTVARIGRFGVERVLGSGTFATVWLARDEDLDAWVAIKLLAENWSFNQDARRRFLEEAKALRRLDDDHIVRVYEIGRLPDDRPYMVMEYADRGTLEDRMRLRSQLDQPFSVREAVEVGMEVAECLIAVHGSRMVHRDVKPSNVLFRSLSPERQEAMRRNGLSVATERTLLGDFGIARRLEGILGHTMVVGSPDYMAPEQADPVRTHHADYRSDIYSAAVILHELLTGELPHRFESAAELLAAGPSAPPPIRGVRPDVPAALERAVWAGLARDPEARVESAWAWRDALRAALLDRAADPFPAGARVRSVTSLEGAAPSRAATATLGGARPGGMGRTLPAATRPGTDVLRPRPGEGPVEVAPSSVAAAPDGRTPRAVRTVDLRAAGTIGILSALAVFTGALLPWSTNELGIAFGESTIAIGLAALLFLAGVRMWRTRRRWVATVASMVAALSGLAAAAVGLYEILRIGGRDAQGMGPGPAVILCAGMLALTAGSRALKRLRLVGALPRA
jgi:hypothetical protein